MVSMCLFSHGKFWSRSENINETGKPIKLIDESISTPYYIPYKRTQSAPATLHTQPDTDGTQSAALVYSPRAYEPIVQRLGNDSPGTRPTSGYFSFPAIPPDTVSGQVSVYTPRSYSPASTGDIYPDPHRASVISSSSPSPTSTTRHSHLLYLPYIPPLDLPTPELRISYVPYSPSRAGTLKAPTRPSTSHTTDSASTATFTANATTQVTAPTVPRSCTDGDTHSDTPAEDNADTQSKLFRRHAIFPNSPSSVPGSAAGKVTAFGRQLPPGVPLRYDPPVRNLAEAHRGSMEVQTGSVAMFDKDAWYVLQNGREVRLVSERGDCDSNDSGNGGRW